MRKIRTRLSIAALVAITMALSIGVGASTASHTGRAEFHITLRWDSTVPTNTGVLAGVDTYFATQVTRLSKGRVIFNTAYGSAYGAPAQIPALLQAGTIHIATTAAAFYPTQLPSMALLNSAGTFLFDSSAKASKVSTAIASSTIFQDEAAANGMRLLYTHDTSPHYLIGNNSNGCTLDGLKGANIRATGAVSAAAFKAEGMNPAVVLPTEFYTSLQRGIVDWIPLPIGSMAAAHLQEVGHYLCTANLGSIIGPQVYMSLRAWQKLPKDIQDIFIKVGQMASARDAAYAANDQLHWLQVFKASGVKLLTFPAADQQQWIKAAPDTLGAWVTQMASQGKGTEANKIAALIRQLTGGFTVDTSAFAKVYNGS